MRRPALKRRRVSQIDPRRSPVTTDAAVADIGVADVTVGEQAGPGSCDRIVEKGAESSTLVGRRPFIELSKQSLDVRGVGSGHDHSDRHRPGEGPRGPAVRVGDGIPECENRL
jgi:hypothetical protein